MKKEELGKKLIKELLDFIFPIICLGCGKEGRWLCSDCLNKITFYQKKCPWCEKKSTEPLLCLACQKKSHLDFLLVITSYQDCLIQEFIHNLKYNFAWKIAEDLKPLLTKFFTPFLKKNELKTGKDQPLFLVPIPLHKKRFRERGFNQSEIISRMAAEVLKSEVMPNVLIRRKNTSSQMTLARKERLINMKDAFECINPKLINNKKIMLIDDVLTTGATLSEAALTLKKAGCRSVGALVLAKEGLIFQPKNARLN